MKKTNRNKTSNRLIYACYNSSRREREREKEREREREKERERERKRESYRAINLTNLTCR